MVEATPMLNEREVYEAQFTNYMVGLLILDGTNISRDEAIDMARHELDNLDDSDRTDNPEQDAAECMSYWDWDDDGE